MWRAGKLTVEEERRLDERFYFKNELLLLLAQVGFADVVVRGDHSEEEATGDHDFLVFIARKT